MSETRAALGVDFGGVIHGVAYRPNQPDTFLEGNLKKPWAHPQCPARSRLWRAW